MQDRVLIVEDVESCASTLEIAFLSIPGVSVFVTESAQEALRELAAPERHSVSALVTDLNMPRMDGFELIERVRADSRYQRLPIIVISGDTDPDTPERVRKLGANAFFAKPCSPAEVRSKLEQLLNAYRSQMLQHTPEARM